MKQMLKDYVCQYENQLNTAIMNKDYDAPLVDYIVDAWKSLEVVKQIKFKGYTYTEKESDIDINKHIFKREKNKKRKEKYDVKFVEDSRVGKLTVELEITMLETDPQTGESKMIIYPLKKSMLIPLADEDGRYYIRGKHYYLIFKDFYNFSLGKTKNLNKK